MRRRMGGGEVEAGRRRRILETLRLQGPKTARELARSLGGGQVAMRAHLRNLHAAGLVAHVEEHQPLGRPVRRFSLTPAADELFPKRYDLFAVKLVETIVAELGPVALEKVLARWRDDLRGYLDESLPRDSGARLHALATHQSRFGFMAAIEKDEAGVALIERNCPISQVAQRFPQVCEVEAAVFGRALDRNVALKCCQAHGDSLCAFQIGEHAGEETAKCSA